MPSPRLLRSLHHLALGLVFLGFAAGPAFAQTTVAVPCTVRIRPRAAADYDPSTEVLLQGRVIGREDGLILLRMAAGIVRVQAGAWQGTPATAGELAVEIIASKRQEGDRQRFLAREIRHAEGRVVLRDVQGVPLQL